MVDQQGAFLSYDVTHQAAQRHFRTKRNTSWSKQSSLHGGLFSESLIPHTGDQNQANKDSQINGPDNGLPIMQEYLNHQSTEIFYKLSAYGKEFQLNLTLNSNFLSPDFLLEFWEDNDLDVNQNVRRRLCHYTGHVGSSNKSRVIVSTCMGLVSRYRYKYTLPQKKRNFSRVAILLRKNVYHLFFFLPKVMCKMLLVAIKNYQHWVCFPGWNPDQNPDRSDFRA